jgi:hypothetical protein
MNRLRTCWLSLLALAALAASPALTQAGWFGVRNDTGAPVVIQSGVVVNGKVVPGRPLVLAPNEIAWDPVLKPVVKCVAIADPKNPKKILLQTNFPCGPGDAFLSLKMPAAGQYNLAPAQLPKKPGH